MELCFEFLWETCTMCTIVLKPVASPRSTNNPTRSDLCVSIPRVHVEKVHGLYFRTLFIH